MENILFLLKSCLILLNNYNYKAKYDPKNKIFSSNEKKIKKDVVKINNKPKKKKIDKHILYKDFAKNKELYQNILEFLGLEPVDSLDYFLSKYINKVKDNVILLDFLFSRQDEILNNSRPVVLNF